MLVKGQLIEISGPGRSAFIKKGYTYEKGKPLYVKAEDLPPHSCRTVLVECDYCGEKYEMAYTYYYHGILNGIVKKCACKKCRKKKVAESNLIKYGVEWTAQLPSVREKYANTCIERYGVSNANQTEAVKEKKIEKSLEKYGTINVFQSEEIKERSKKTIQERYGVDNAMHSSEIRKRRSSSLDYVNGRQVSKEQKRIAELFEGQLNASIGQYRADILLDDTIVVEYDGAGHGLEVQIGRVPLEEYNKKRKRACFFYGK